MQKGFMVEKVAVTPGFHGRAPVFRYFSTADTGKAPLCAEVDGNIESGAVCCQHHRCDVPGGNQPEGGGVDVLMIHAVPPAVRLWRVLSLFPRLFHLVALTSESVATELFDFSGKCLCRKTKHFVCRNGLI
jgi:hypothetical protein